MADRSHRACPPAPPSTGTGRTPRRPPREAPLFGGIYGLVLASALAAALDSADEAADPGADALWLLLTALASAAAHGYAHVIARRAASVSGGGSVRSLTAEWPLIAAALPTVLLLLTALAGWWAEASAVNAALLVNTLGLCVWGTWAARRAGYKWPAACRVGGLDMVIGLVIILANALIH
jgi:hypothetical protein